MVLPAGVITVALTFGPYLDESGDPMKGTVSVWGVNRLWDATGSVFYGQGVTKELDATGAVIFFLPATDQEGYSDGEGNEIIDWTYRVQLRIGHDLMRECVISLEADGETGVSVDFDTLVPVPLS